MKFFKIGIIIVLITVLTVLISCGKEGKILSNDTGTHDNHQRQTSPGQIHNEILNNYYSVYDFSNWKSVIENELSKGTFHTSGQLDNNKIANYICNNHKTFFDESLYIKAVDDANKTLGITLQENHILSLPFDTKSRKNLWNIDNLPDGYKIIQSRNSNDFYHEWSSYLINYANMHNSIEINHLMEIYTILQDTKITTNTKSDLVYNLNWNTLDPSEVSNQFIEHLNYTDNIINFYKTTNIYPINALLDIAGPDDIAYAGAYAEIGCRCNSCNPTVYPYEISHGQHIREAEYRGACGSVSGDIFSVFLYIISQSI